MKLISQFELMYNVTEEDEAFRLRVSYGLQRAGHVTDILAGKTTPAPLRAFWWRVGYLLSQMRNDAPPPPKEHEGIRIVVAATEPIPLTVEIPAPTPEAPEGKLRITKQEFRAWIKRPQDYKGTLGEFLATQRTN